MGHITSFRMFIDHITECKTLCQSKHKCNSFAKHTKIAVCYSCSNSGADVNDINEGFLFLTFLH